MLRRLQTGSDHNPGWTASRVRFGACQCRGTRRSRGGGLFRRSLRSLRDKGFLGEDWQALIRDLTGNRIWTVKRENQHIQNPAVFDILLNSVRERIEGVFHEIQNTGRNLERLLAKTTVGLCTRIIAKMTSYTLKLLLRRDFGINVQTFEISPI